MNTMMPFGIWTMVSSTHCRATHSSPKSCQPRIGLCHLCMATTSSALLAAGASRASRFDIAHGAVHRKCNKGASHAHATPPQPRPTASTTHSIPQPLVLSLSAIPRSPVCSQYPLTGSVAWIETKQEEQERLH